MVGIAAVIGLEVHAQLKTRTKLFCGCPNEFGGEPNARVCPVCLGLPGALPRANAEAVRLAVRFAHAVGATVHPTSIWARKNYFYPDLPRGYQISQYDRPLATGGAIRIELPGSPPRFVPLTRVHLEEDAGKSVHENFEGRTGIDLNRCGVPLIEIVGEAALGSPEEAYLYLERLKSILKATDVCDADMEKGFLRCDANVSVHRPPEPWGTRVEIKNLNSFRHVRSALAHEIERQSALVAAGGSVVQETRLWNEGSGTTQPMRSKEEAHDYRYFPEPDMPPLEVGPELLAAAIVDMPELPHVRRDRYVAAGVPEADAHRLTIEPALSAYFDRVAAICEAPRAAANWVLSELLGRLNREGLPIEESPLPADRLGRLVKMVEAGAITGKTAKDVFEASFTLGVDPESYVAEKGLARVGDAAAIEAACRAVIEAFPAQAEQYRAGKAAVLGFLVGHVMKATRGAARPDLVQATLARLLS